MLAEILGMGKRREVNKSLDERLKNYPQIKARFEKIVEIMENSRGA